MGCRTVDAPALSNDDPRFNLRKAPRCVRGFDLSFSLPDVWRQRRCREPCRSVRPASGRGEAWRSLWTNRPGVTRSMRPRDRRIHRHNRSQVRSGAAAAMAQRSRAVSRKPPSRDQRQAGRESRDLLEQVKTIAQVSATRSRRSVKWSCMTSPIRRTRSSRSTTTSRVVRSASRRRSSGSHASRPGLSSGRRELREHVRRWAPGQEHVDRHQGA